MGALLGLIPLPVRIGLMVAALLGAALGGWQVRGWKEDAARLDAERVAHENYRKTTEGWAAAVQVITAERETDRQQAAADRRAWQKELNDAKRNGTGLVVCRGGGDRPQASDPGAVSARLTGAAVRVWNDGLDIGLPKALRAGRADEPGTAADLSGAVAIDDAFDNHAVNAEQCNDLRGKLLAWQAWARSIGAGK
jgi:hypothetical protein